MTGFIAKNKLFSLFVNDEYYIPYQDAMNVTLHP